MSQIKILWSNEDITKAIKKTETGGIPLVIKFHAPWCEPCKMISVGYESMSDSYHSTVKFASMNVDLDDDAARLHQINIIPAIHVWSAGVLVASHIRFPGVTVTEYFELVEKTIRKYTKMAPKRKSARRSKSEPPIGTRVSICNPGISLVSIGHFGYLGCDEASDSSKSPETRSCGSLDASLTTKRCGSLVPNLPMLKPERSPADSLAIHLPDGIEKDLDAAFAELDASDDTQLRVSSGRVSDASGLKFESVVKRQRTRENSESVI